MNLNKFTISESKTVIEAIDVINKSGSGFVLTKKNNSISGILTDGDIRRIFLKKKNLYLKCKNYLKKKFIYIDKNNKNFEKKISYFLKKKIRYIPILDNKKQLVDVIIDNYFRITQQDNIYSNTTVIILAGGKGERMMPLTKSLPKPMLQINNKPMIENIIDEFSKNGFRKFLISVNYLSNKIIKHFKHKKFKKIKIDFLKENKFLGSAGSLSLLDKNKISKNFFVINCDIYTTLNFSKMLDHHIKKKSEITIGSRIYEHKIPFGVIKKIGNKNSIEEKPIVHYNINSGIYIFNNKILNKMKKNKFIDMNNFINSLKLSKSIYTINEPFYDIGDLGQYYKISKLIKNLKN
jgi:dTDP-glucose pyrophosphorylase